MMTNVQKHRGPNDQKMSLFSLRKRTEAAYGPHGSYLPQEKCEGGVGFNRLSILDLSGNGSQPMYNEDRSVFIVFNGEIYNAFQYAPELKKAGFRFKSRTDTEIILYLYELHGFPGMLERLNGMFAICIVDLNKQEIYLARDRMGIKPLYWYLNSGSFLFSSEVKSFLYHPCFKTELDTNRIDEYFMFRYCALDGFLMKGVNQLEPGHWIRLSPKGWENYRYWEIPDGPIQAYMPFDIALENLEKHLHRSVKSQLLSDVKVGCQLSGGIDSSLINVFAKIHSGADMDAFSIIFDDPQLSEERWIENAVSLSKMQAHKYILNNNYFISNLEKATWHMDQPLNHPNSVGIFSIAEHARTHVTVLLSGEGADELFGGYSRFYYALLRNKLRLWSPVLNRVPYVGKRFMRVFGHLGGVDSVDWFIGKAAFGSADHLVQIRPETCLERIVNERRAIFEEGKGNYLSNCLKYDLRTYLVDCLIRQDKMTMAHSVENRVPFLDHELLTYVRNLPSHYLVEKSTRFIRKPDRQTKVILKQLARKYFHHEFVYRQKSGFGLPLKSYFTDPQFRPIMMDQLLPGMRNRGIVEANMVERWWRDIESEKGNNAIIELLWICIAFEIWAEQFLDRRQ